MTDETHEEASLNALLAELNTRNLNECIGAHAFTSLRDSDLGLIPECFFICDRCRGVVGPTAMAWWERGKRDAVNQE